MCIRDRAHLLNNLAVAAQGDNKWPEAVSMYGRASALFGAIGDTDNEANAMFNHAEVLVEQGHAEAALPLLAEAVEAAWAAGDEELAAYALRLSGRALSRAGRHEEALDQLLSARSVFAGIGEEDEVRAVDLARAEALLLRGEDSDALELLDEHVGADLDVLARAQALWLRGFALLGLDRLDEATPVLQSGLAAAAEAGSSYLSALCTLGLVRAHVHESTEEDALTVLRDLGVVEVPLLSQVVSPQGS